MARHKITIPAAAAEALRPFIYNAIDELRGKGERELSLAMDRLGNVLSLAVIQVNEQDDNFTVELTLTPGDN